MCSFITISLNPLYVGIQISKVAIVTVRGEIPNYSKIESIYDKNLNINGSALA